MHPAVLLENFPNVGKLTTPIRSETIDIGPSDSKPLHVRDISSGLIYLVDTGSDISLLPADSNVLKQNPNDLVLFAANNSRVSTFGERSVTLNFNLRRPIKWNFCVAAVPYPILGADLLAHYHLVPFLHESRLVDTTTGLSTRGFLKSALICGLGLVNRDHAFSNVLASFPELTSLPQKAVPIDIDVQHHILTFTWPTIRSVSLRTIYQKLPS